MTLRRIALSTGVELDVAIDGAEGAPAIIFLHGFPESHRTWRHQFAALADRHRVIAPDQRGFARSSKPADVADYAANHVIADLLALADALGIDRFTLVGHDWGGAIAWGAAIKHPERIERLAIANAPHPLIFQRSLFDDPDQRAASQYMRTFRQPGVEAMVGAMGLKRFFDKSFAPHVGADIVAPERATYIDQWSQPGALAGMLNWYRAAPIIVPPSDGPLPDRPTWIDQPFPMLTMPVLVMWGMRDRALLPCQIEGLDEVVADLTLVEIDAGHFVPWEAPDAVTAALNAWLGRA